jgi:hypothetical protein
MRIALVVLLLWIGAFAGVAHAHEFRPAVLGVRQTGPGQFAWHWAPAFDAERKPLRDVEPVFPSHCTVDGPRLDCGDRGLGAIEIAGLDRHPVDVVVRVRWSDDRERTAVLRGDDARVELDDATVGDTTLALLSTYLALGVEHILIGIDHVLFVLGLLLLVGWHRRLLWAITGFTVAHSITLAASTLDWAALPQAPVEAAIALSIVLLATELVHERDTITRRHPGVVALAFGLLHGFGFAGALREIGVPPDRTFVALLGFNLGVEIGQLMIIAAALGVGLLARHLPHLHRWRLAAIYCGGTVAAMWAIERIAGMA